VSYSTALQSQHATSRASVATVGIIAAPGCCTHTQPGSSNDRPCVHWLQSAGHWSHIQHVQEYTGAGVTGLLTTTGWRQFDRRLSSWRHAVSTCSWQHAVLCGPGNTCSPMWLLLTQQNSAGVPSGVSCTRQRKRQTCNSAHNVVRATIHISSL
jgi:hypothetical protein